jgi:hypothetical protein
MASTLALGLAGLDRAKTLFRWRFYAHLITLATALIGIILPHEVEYYVAVLAFASEATARWCHHSALGWHALGREAMRLALLSVSYGKVGTSEEISDLVRRFGKTGIEWAEKYTQEYLANYYKSTEPPGRGRMSDLLRQSIFFSAELYTTAARRSLIWGTVLLSGAFLVALLVLPSVAAWMGTATFTAARLFIVVVAFLPASDELDHLTLWNGAAERARSLDLRMAHVGEFDSDQLWIFFADYAAITASAPPVPAQLYFENREHLNKLWELRKQP